MEDFGSDMAVEVFLLQYFGRLFHNVLGIMPLLMLLIFCVIYTPIIINMLKSAYRADEIPP